MKTYSVELIDHVAEVIDRKAEELGLTPVEQIRVCLGSWAYQVSPPQPRPIFMRAVPENPDPTSEDGVIMMRLSIARFKREIKEGAVKCRYCTLPLTWEDLKKNECSSCGKSDPLEI